MVQRTRGNVLTTVRMPMLRLLQLGRDLAGSRALLKSRGWRVIASTIHDSPVWRLDLLAVKPKRRVMVVGIVEPRDRRAAVRSMLGDKRLAELVAAGATCELHCWTRSIIKARVKVVELPGSLWA